MKHLIALVLTAVVWAGSQLVSPQPLPFALAIIATVATVYLAPIVWAWSEGPAETDQRRLHEGATAYEQRPIGEQLSLLGGDAGVDLDPFGRPRSVVDPDGIEWNVRGGTLLQRGKP